MFATRQSLVDVPNAVRIAYWGFELDNMVPGQRTWHISRFHTGQVIA